MLDKDMIIERLIEQANEIVSVKLPAIEEKRDKIKASRDTLTEMQEQITGLLVSDEVPLQRLRVLTEEFDALNKLYEDDIAELEELISSVQSMRG